MTLEETIKYHLDIADGQDKCADISVSEHAKERISECANNNRQIAEWLMELKEAKRLLKLAVENMNDGGCTRSCSTCKYGRDGCKYTEGYEWVHTEEAAKLLKEAENG